MILRGCSGFVGEAEAGKTGEVGGLEVELGQGRHVEGEVGRYAVGPGEGVEDGEAHVGDRDLGEDAAVNVLHQRMDGGLGVDGYLDARGRKVEEAAGFDDFEALVEHGGGVDGDALAHDPGGVLEGLRGGDAVEVGERGVAEGAAGGREPDLFDFGGGAGAEALVDGVVLGVDGEEVDVVLAGGGEDEVAGGYEAFLVGEADGFAGEDRGVGGFETGYTYDGRYYEVDGGEGGASGPCRRCRGRSSMPVMPFCWRRVWSWSARGSVATRDDFGAPAAALLEERCRGWRRRRARWGGSGRGATRRCLGCSGRWSRWSRGRRSSSHCLF